MSPIYDPQLPDGVKVHDLTPASEAREALTPETSVLVINRGRETLVRKFDGRDYPLRPFTEGVIRMPYGAALHFQKHCVVPGTRDVASGAEQSYIGILGIDPEALCRPLEEAELEAAERAPEAIQREPGEEVEAIPVSRQVASGKVPVRGQSTRRRSSGFARTGKTAKGDEVDRDDVMRADDTAQERIDAVNEAGDDPDDQGE